jgi:hypothetical protein
VEFSRLTVLGIGSVRCGHSIVSSKASYFGERKLEITFYDSDAERLDLFERLARSMFAFNDCTHELTATDDPVEALSGAERVIVAVGPNCARKQLKLTAITSEERQRFVKSLLSGLEEGTPILSLLAGELQLEGSNTWNIAWPDQIPQAERVLIPHQILRFVRGDEYPYSWLQDFDRSPVKLWLDNPASLPLE